MKVLLIIDVLKDFMEEGGSLSCGEEARKIIPHIKERIAEYRRKAHRIVYVCDAHEKEDKEFKMYSPHAVKGSEGAEIIDELKPRENDIVVEKTTVRPFYGNDLEEVIDKLSPEEVEVAGVCTSICVMEAVAALSVRGYNAVVDRKLVADFAPDAHKYALKRMKEVFGAQIR